MNEHNVITTEDFVVEIEHINKDIVLNIWLRDGERIGKHEYLYSDFYKEEE